MEQIGAPSLYANIPIINIKNDVKAEKIKDGTLIYENGELGKNVVEECVENFIPMEKSIVSSENLQADTKEIIDESNEVKNREVIELGEPKSDIFEKNEEEKTEYIVDIHESETIYEKNETKENFEDSLEIEAEKEAESENINQTLDFDDDDDDDDVTFDDLLKKAEEEEAIQNVEIVSEKKSGFSKLGINQKPIRSKKGTKQNKS